MEPSVPVRKPWHPLTFSSVAALAQAPSARVQGFAVLVAMVVTTSFIWFIYSGWQPVILETIRSLPEQGMIRQGLLEWPGRSPVVLGKNSFFAISVDLEESAPSGSQADIQCEWGKAQVKLRSLFGYVSLSYPQHWFIPLDRTQVEAWWGAWEPFLWISLGMGLMSLWLCVWTILAALYASPLRLVIFFLDRQGTWLTCWRLSLAAQLPGALWLALAIRLYGWHHLDLVAFLFAFGLHALMSWIYLLFALSLLPYLSSKKSRAKNPFKSASEEAEHTMEEPHALK